MTSAPDDPPEDEGRTVFVPRSLEPPAPPPSPPAEAEQPPAPAEMPSAPPPLSQPPAASTPPVSEFSARPSLPASSWGNAPPPPGSGPDSDRRIQVGDVLNHIFEVRRFIARGGMGEVFEGANVNSDERVAIKVMLPSLAADPNVQAMFRKEARTLTRLNHQALVQYRVLAQEPQLRVFYIVTEYVDGPNLSDVMATLEATPTELLALVRRLAGGLRVAHSLGAIHRDIAPDNVMLEGGKLEGAKIIDFGIAKDLDPSTATIVGDGFAGKLNYVAPEQLGDFDRVVGAWSDVYSLGLVILAIAQKKHVNMGVTPVEAVDKRRAGVDVSGAPIELQPVLTRMLEANPANRLRSMDEVIDMLPGGASAPSKPPQKGAAMPKVSMPKVSMPKMDTAKLKVPLLAGAGVVALALGGWGLYAMLTGGEDAPAEAVKTAEAPVADPVSVAQSALATALPQVPCTWLDTTALEASDNGVALAMAGVAGNPAQANEAVVKALGAQKVKVGALDFSAVHTVSPSLCSTLDALRQIRDPAGGHIKLSQPKFEIMKADQGRYSFPLVAEVVFDLELRDEATGMSVYGVDDKGGMFPLFADRSAIKAPLGQALGNDAFRATVGFNEPATAGFLLIRGANTSDPTLLSGTPESRGADWAQKLVAAAKERGWKAEMAWFKAVNDQPD